MSVLFTAVLGAILCVFAALIFFTVRGVLYRDFDHDLKIKASQVTAIVDAYGKLNSQEQPETLMKRFLSGSDANDKQIIDELWQRGAKSLHLDKDYFGYFTGDSRLIFKSENLPSWLATTLKQNLASFPMAIYYKDLREEKSHLRAGYFPVVDNGRLLLTFVLATPLERIDNILAQLFVYMVAGIAGILLLSSSFGSFFTGRILKSITSIIETANAITHKDLTVRISEREADEEIKSLSNALNLMIARLEKSFTYINEFSSHVAHELKTPLAIIKGELELALSEEGSRAEDKIVMGNALEEINRLIKITKDLLLLAMLDHRPDIFKFEKLNLIEVLKDIYQHGNVLASEKGIMFNLKVPLSDIAISADRIHLRRLFFNLIHNAIKFTPGGGRIDMAACIQDKKVLISVTDTGEGIPEEGVPKIFEKFQRFDKNRHLKETGTGLGLSIAQAIAKIHQGEITVKSKLGQGATFTVSLPLV